ncbi:permease [Nitrogeniibacter aestuarii]|uniref:permease n=1 Tax=Nitrogeniibacter aestuarii TaxID=2815343 RepID=UPI001D120884|nr:permease [Nitrogeniibacter aestuarii]
MFVVFSRLADLIVYGLLGMAPHTRAAEALHFFIEDTSKILVMLVVMIYAIALIRASLNVERVRAVLSGQHRFVGYGLGAGFGAITPFCSCSSIPVFLGFTSAGIPVGVTMAFLLTSPLINEVAVLMLLGLLGWEMTLIYIGVGLAVGMLGGFFLDLIHAERLLQPFAAKAYAKRPAAQTVNDVAAVRLSLAERHAFAKAELADIFGRVWKWVFIGVGIGAGLHGFVPDGWLEAHLGAGQWWSVPAAVVLGIPLYSNATGVIPVMESLLLKGLPVGTTLAFCMSTVAASLPEFILLKQAMQLKLLAILFAMLLVSFTLVGWILNLVGTF